MTTKPELPKKQVPPELRFYTVEDVAEMLQMSMRGVYDLMRKEKWPHSKYGSRIRFEYADLEAVRAMHRVEAPAPRARSTRIGTETAPAKGSRLQHPARVKRRTPLAFLGRPLDPVYSHRSPGHCPVQEKHRVESPGKYKGRKQWHVKSPTASAACCST